MAGVLTVLTACFFFSHPRFKDTSFLWCVFFSILWPITWGALLYVRFLKPLVNPGDHKQYSVRNSVDHILMLLCAIPVMLLFMVVKTYFNLP